MKRIDIVAIKSAVKAGQISAFVNADGYIILRDNQTGEGVCIGKTEKGETKRETE